MAKKKLDDANRPRVHPELDADADPAIRWASPQPPAHGGEEVLVQRPHDAAEAVYVDGVWISPGEVAYVSKKQATKVEKA